MVQLGTAGLPGTSEARWGALWTQWPTPPPHASVSPLAHSTYPGDCEDHLRQGSANSSILEGQARCCRSVPQATLGAGGREAGGRPGLPAQMPAQVGPIRRTRGPGPGGTESSRRLGSVQRPVRGRRAAGLPRSVSAQTAGVPSPGVSLPGPGYPRSRLMCGFLSQLQGDPRPDPCGPGGWRPEGRPP